MKAEEAIAWTRSRWWTLGVVASLIIASEIGAWYFLASARSVIYKTILIVGYIAVLICLILARRIRFAASAGLGIVCGLPVAAIYLVADVLH